MLQRLNYILAREIVKNWKLGGLFWINWIGFNHKMWGYYNGGIYYTLLAIDNSLFLLDYYGDYETKCQ